MIQISVQALQRKAVHIALPGQKPSRILPAAIFRSAADSQIPLVSQMRSTSALDPCVGDGAAFEVITSGAEVFRYGIELDAYRAEQSKQRIQNVIQGNALEVQCAVECFGLQFLNPPYDWTLGPGDSRRTEQMFLSHTYRWLKPAGILVLVIPSERLAECSHILASHFRDVRVYRLEAPECVRYKQVVVIGARRSRREKERLTDSDITRARLYYAGLARNPSQIPVLPHEPEARYDVPVSGPAQLVYRGLPLDEIEDLLPQSTAYRQAGRILFAEPRVCHRATPDTLARWSR
jgi:16S rRNA G966 N2-methylase RsmD